MGLFRALAAIATLFLPWVKFEHDTAYHLGIFAITYPFTHGWDTVWHGHGYMTIPMGIGSLLLLTAIYIVTLSYATRSVRRSRTDGAAAILLVMVTLWLIITIPHREHYHYAVGIVYAVYGYDLYFAWQNRAAANQYRTQTSP